MNDRRQLILDAALGVLREQGLAGFTQPRIALRSGLRQSHLTYYYPTRLDLLVATGEAATDALLAELDRSLDGQSRQSVAASIADIAIRPDNTRVMMALAGAADTEPSIKATFRRLAIGIAQRSAVALTRGQSEPNPDSLLILHGLAVGLAVINLATGDGSSEGQRRAARLLQIVLQQLFPEADR